MEDDDLKILLGGTDGTSSTGNGVFKNISTLNNNEMGNLGTINLNNSLTDTPWFKNADVLGAGAGLASTLLQAVSLPTMLKQAKLQNKALRFNLDTAKAEQGRRNQNISAFNAFKG